MAPLPSDTFSHKPCECLCSAVEMGVGILPLSWVFMWPLGWMREAKATHLRVRWENLSNPTFLLNDSSPWQVPRRCQG